MDSNTEDTFEDLQDLEKAVLAKMSEKDKKDLRFTRNLMKGLDWVFGITIALSAIGAGIYNKTAPEQTNTQYNNLTQTNYQSPNLPNLSTPSTYTTPENTNFSDSYSETTPNS